MIFGKGSSAGGIAARIPRATYRLQLGQTLSFREAALLVDYLDELGVSDIYASPILETPPGSAHGYSVSDVARLSETLGSEEDFDALVKALHQRSMGLLVDVVPNHMAAHASNRWWRDVLRNGRCSRYAKAFDIDWNRHNGRVYLPTLGAEMDEALRAGDLKLSFHDRQFVVRYFENTFPLSVETEREIFREIALRIREGGGIQPGYAAGLHDCFRKLVHATQSVEEVDRFVAGAAADEKIRKLFESVLERFNGSSERLQRTFEQQHYKLAYWKTAADEINYRRFFDINELVALRMEEPEIFRDVHQKLLAWIASGKITGLRIDHPDGLRDPKGYFRDLQIAALEQGGGTDILPALNALAEDSAMSPHWPLYVVAEKILTRDEPLPRDWMVYGTTGYDFLTHLNSLYVNQEAERAFTDFYGQFTGLSDSFHTVEAKAKREALKMSFRGDITNLAQRALELARQTPEGTGITLDKIRDALVELICSFEVYRTYAEPAQKWISPQDEAALAKAFESARSTDIDRSALKALRRLLSLDVSAEVADTREFAEFVWRFQQMSGPLTAKGVEDTAFYRYNRFVSLNEVGGDPARFGLSPDGLHERLTRRAEQWPNSMLATATHDTKRGEDCRARLNALSEFPEEWFASVTRWRQMNQHLKTQISGSQLPDPNDEYLFYQTLVGAWGFKPEMPTLTERVAAYMLKAIREAKTNSSWTDSNGAYEQALERFVRGVMAKENSAFLADFEKFLLAPTFFGVVNSLSQTALKLTAPGVPDIYNGCEFWDFSLVDPDNRRPVDFELRRKSLRDLKVMIESSDRSALLASLLSDHASPLSKLFVTAQILNERRSKPALFERGSYQQITSSGQRQNHVLAFSRKHDRAQLAVVLPRLPATITNREMSWPIGFGAWGDTAVDCATLTGSWRDLFTQRTIEVRPQMPVGEILSEFPVAALVR